MLDTLDTDKRPGQPTVGERGIGRRRQSLGPRPVRDRYALLVGINNYVEPTFTPLRYCVNDVKALAGRLRQLRYAVVEMHDEVKEEYHRPRLDDVLSELDRLCALVTEDDLLLVYLGCHGVREQNQTLLLMQDTRRARLLERSLPLEQVEKALRASRARCKVMILDACHSGVDVGRAVGSDSEGRTILDHPYELGEGFALLASSTAQQRAQESNEKGHGVFTFFLLQGLSGAADFRNNGMITVDDLNAYVLKEVRRWSAEHGGLLQEPTARTEGIGSIELADLRQSQTVAPLPSPVLEPVSPPKPALHDVIRFCNRNRQWQDLQQLAEKQDLRLVFLPGPDGEAHDYFLQRLLTWEGDRRFLVLKVEWLKPLPPRNQDDYFAALAKATGCPSDHPDQISAHLAVLGHERRIILQHPTVYEHFLEQALCDYYVSSWQQIRCPGKGILCLQPVAWERSAGLRRYLARLLKWPWLYPSAWLRRCATDVQALQMLQQIEQRAPVGVHVLDELTPITEQDILAFCKNHGIPEPMRTELAMKALDGSPDSKACLNRMMEYLDR